VQDAGGDAQLIDELAAGRPGCGLRLIPPSAPTPSQPSRRHRPPLPSESRGHQIAQAHDGELRESLHAAQTASDAAATALAKVPPDLAAARVAHRLGLRRWSTPGTARSIAPALARLALTPSMAWLFRPG